MSPFGPNGTAKLIEAGLCPLMLYVTAVIRELSMYFCVFSYFDATNFLKFSDYC